MAYTQNEKSTGLDPLPVPDNADLVIMGDVSDAGRAKATVFTDFVTAVADYITNILGGFVNSVTGLNTDNTDPQNPVVRISVDGSTIVGLGTPGSPLSAIGGGGSGSGGGGSMSASNVTLFDDFVSSYLGKDAANPDMTISGNFGGEDITFILAELDHPGIARMSTSGDTLIGFSDFDETGTFGVAENLNYDNDFDITFLSRLTYNGTYTVQWQLLGTTDTITLEITDAAVSYDIGAGVVPTAVPVPATTIWFQPRFVYSGGTLTIYINSSVVFSGAVALADSFQLRENITAIGGGDSLDFDTDYVVTKYQTSRTSPAWGGGSEKKVGVGEIDDITWFNIQYPFSMINSTDPEGNIWTITGITQINPSLVPLGVGDSIKISSDQDGILPDLDVPGRVYNFDSTKQSIFQITGLTTAVSGTNIAGIGFFEKGGVSFEDQLGTNNVGIGFIRNAAGQWFARTGNGAAFTQTAITISDGKHVFRLEYDPGNAIPQARYYVDGVLLETVTTTLPTAATGVVFFGAGNNAADDGLEVITCPSFTVEI